MEPEKNKPTSVSAMLRYIVPIAAIACACAVGLPLGWRYWKSYDSESKANQSISAKVDILYTLTPLLSIDISHSDKNTSISVCEDGTLDAICSDKGMSRYVFGELFGGVFLTYIPAPNSEEPFFLARDSNGDGINEYDEFYPTDGCDKSNSADKSMSCLREISSHISSDEYPTFNATYEKHLNKAISILGSTLGKKTIDITYIKFPRKY